MELIQLLNWRYASKRMKSQKVPAEKLDRILEAIRLSASSMGLQPYNVLVITNDELREKIAPIAYNQPQIKEASHLLVFAAWEKADAGKINDYISQIAAERGVPVDSLKDFRSTIENAVNSRPEEVTFNWLARQAYIALGTGLIAAAAEEVDATPMEGFDTAAMDEILQLKEKGLKSLAILALGYRDADKDFLAKAKKVRRTKEKLFINLN